MVRVRGGGCAASKRGAQIVPFVQDQDDLTGSRDPVRPNADGDDTNLDDIDELISPQVGTPLPPKLHQALTALDKIVIQVLMCGAIRLLCVKWLLMQPENFKMPNRQELEALEKSGASPSPLLSREEAAALVERGDRSIGALTYGWLMSGDPDPAGSRIRVLRRALARLAIEALFWDFGSLYQAPRTPEQKDFFEIALKGGGDESAVCVDPCNDRAPDRGDPTPASRVRWCCLLVQVELKRRRERGTRGAHRVRNYRELRPQPQPRHRALYLA
jgi:hypothetical protein